MWFSDFYASAVKSVSLSGDGRVELKIDDRPSGLGWMPDGSLLVVSMTKRQVLRRAGDGKVAVHADLSDIAGFHCNDMVVDAAGRAYVGNFGFDRHRGEPQRTTCIARVDPDGTVTRAADELSFPNGTVITPDGRRLIVAETLAHRLTAFDVAVDGTLSNRRTFAALEGCFPDGICLDAEGAVWVADARTPRVLRVLDGGRIERSIPTGARFAFACMLGDDDRRTLYLCTSAGSGPAMADKRDGAIERVRVEIPGAGLP